MKSSAPKGDLYTLLPHHYDSILPSTQEGLGFVQRLQTITEDSKTKLKPLPLLNPPKAAAQLPLKKKKRIKQEEEDPKILSSDVIEQLHLLWKEYTKDWEIKHSKEALLSKLARAEFVGARLKIVRAKNTQLVGLCGIVTQETQFTFILQTKTKKKKRVPKKNVVFSLEIGEKEFILLGSNLLLRSTDRGVRKLKFKHFVE